MTVVGLSYNRRLKNNGRTEPYQKSNDSDRTKPY